MESEKFWRVNASLNVRGGPTAASEKIGSLKTGDVIEKTGENETKDWFRIIANGTEGWVSMKYLVKVPFIPPLDEDFAWMAIAEAEKGVREIPGEENRPRVLEYLAATSNLGRSAISKDETPWCSAFVNWCLKQAGYAGTNNAAARSWMDWGEAIQTPRRGCIVVFQREQKFGHVGFYLEETETEIKVLGGNQQDKETLLFEVSEKNYPKSDWLGYRIPA